MKISDLKYVDLSEISLVDFITLLNKNEIRKHLIKHEKFDVNSVKSWLDQKLAMDRSTGCRVRGIVVNDSFAGWCGIQYLEEKYEIAIVLDPECWGLGTRIFIDIMSWAKELGHGEIYIHLLQTRPEYKFLRKMAHNVYNTDQLGNKFTTYLLKVR